MKKRIVSLFLSVICLVNLITISVKADVTNSLSNNPSDIQSTDLSFKKYNFNFIKTSDISDIEYTYQENEKTYLVKESANENLTFINTEIYEVAEESNILISNSTTTIEKSNNVLLISTNDNNNVITTYVDINNGSIKINDFQTTSLGTYNGWINYDAPTGKYFTDYHDTGLPSHTGSNIVIKFTLTVIIGMLSGISANPVVTGGITAAAQFIIDQQIPTIYWSKTWEEVWEVTYPGRQYINSYVGRKTYATFYADSSRTDYIGSDSWEWRDPVYFPSILK